MDRDKGQDFEYKLLKPDKSIADFVESFWMLQNHSDYNKDVVILPDGRVDLFFSRSATEPFHITLSGLETQSDQAILTGKTIMFAISFKLPAIEYFFHNTVSTLLNNAKYLPVDFWGFNEKDIQDFDFFCEKAAQKIQTLLPREIDNRKRKLFDLIYASKGTLSVNALSEEVSWSSRQINRFFRQQFGLSLKAYCNILRFRASFPDIKEGKLFPQENFADQSHFIKEVKKLAGVSPKELKRNQNGRFIQFLTLPSK
ncbi:AraC-type helix-turn-helix domain-containing protein [Sporocytophaga myxococcoides]|uniref:AraC-type helix-turn-helix domain-containing protein n=1 Tax=Sporocytophaga myxococcoides TaxID=153721 RepID=A0A098LM38_9BACT|nr:AraC family transcriptional regulator [Sporocytophaga myxococcoides]GAL87397.1 AraC-type helix-turn-helix domain-containing protein [Sporocytophaga myxococcoides]